ncbi:hypothetical protein SEUCBS139899_003405 [Sporothrix eucalyptigena]
MQAMQKKIEELEALNIQGAEQVQHYENSRRAQGFLMQCCLYFEYQAPNLGDDMDNVFATVAYMDGLAAAWAQLHLDGYPANKHDPDNMNDDN